MNRLMTCALLAMSISANAAFAEPLTAERYVELDLQVLRSTLANAEQRLTLLELGGNFSAEVRESTDNSAAIASLYRAAHTTPVAALRWHARHQPEVNALLAARPELASEYDRLRAALEAASAQLQSLRGQPHYKD